MDANDETPLQLKTACLRQLLLEIVKQATIRKLENRVRNIVKTSLSQRVSNIYRHGVGNIIIKLAA